MPSLAKSALYLTALALPAFASDLPYFTVLSEDAGAWPAILSSIGLQRSATPAAANIGVARAGSFAAPDWAARIDKGLILILEGESPLAESLGFRRTAESVRVNSLTDSHLPELPVVWEKGVDLPLFQVPPGASIFARERWSGAPLSAGLRRGRGAVLWIAVPPGERGYEHFPYLLNALTDLGVEAPFRSSRLWAFFDASYRTRVDLDYFAVRWRKAGIAALHVAAWHHFERDPEQDAFLRKLIEACHREGILVYAWLELPHVSEKFWTDHPEWREKTGVLQDAELDWRKLMNLSNRDCFQAVASGVGELISRFDWDGVNLAELYFESLEGIRNPARFTPMNANVRAEFKAAHGFDPVEVFSTRQDAASQRLFLDFRAGLARRMQEEWLGEVETIRRTKPHLDLVLTHVDDRFDTGMRDAIGADAARVLPLLDSHAFTFLIEDPATVWHLGSQRYQTIAERYRAITPHAEKLAVDLNIVERYQNVYPTKQQTGTELFQLVHSAAANFQRVALYFEKSLLPPDWALLPSAAARVNRIERQGAKTIVDSPFGVGLPWKGSALVDGESWPASDGETVWIPAGVHQVEAGEPPSPLSTHILRVNGELVSARWIDAATVEFRYRSAARAIVVLDRIPAVVQIDGKFVAVPVSESILLPPGDHLATVTTRPTVPQ